MQKLPSIVALNVLAICVGVLGLSAIPDALFLVYLVAGLNEIPAELRTAVCWQAIRTIGATVLLLGLAVWLATRAAAMWRSRKAALAQVSGP